MIIHGDRADGHEMIAGIWKAAFAAAAHIALYRRGAACCVNNDMTSARGERTRTKHDISICCISRTSTSRCIGMRRHAR